MKGELHETAWKSGRGLRPAPRCADADLWQRGKRTHRRGAERAVLTAKWDDDETIQSIIRELNFGRYAPGQGKDGEA